MYDNNTVETSFPLSHAIGATSFNTTCKGFFCTSHQHHLQPNHQRYTTIEMQATCHPVSRNNKLVIGPYNITSTFF
uniref:Uncharacterized protein n=1 Tax=Arundo donax TaxID=35708 RepID=A0A0A9C5N6_ARUDO